MKRELYEHIKEILLSEAGISTVALYRMPDADMMAKSPLVMIEFTNVGYENMSNKKQEATALFTAHLLWDTISLNDDSEVFDVTQKMYVALSRSGYIRRSESNKVFDEGTIDYQIVFEAPRFEDDDAIPGKIVVEKKPLNIIRV